MAEEILDQVEQQIPTGPGDPPTKAAKLYRNLINEGYTKDNLGSEDEFSKALQDSVKATTIYKGLLREGYTEANLGKMDEFISSFTPTQTDPVKKKSSRIDFEKSSLDYGNTSSPLPLQSDGENSINPILGEITEIKDLESKTKDIPMPSSGKGGNIIVKVPDNVSIGEAKRKKENFKNIYGIDFDEFSGEIKDLPDYVYKNEGFLPEQLIEVKKYNPQNYQRRIATARVQSGIRDMINKQFQDGNIDENTRKNLLSTEKINTNNYNVGDYQQQRNLVKSQATLIDEIGGENAEKLKSQLAVERAKIYGDSYKNGFENVAKDATESKYLDNNALLGYQYIKDLSPEKAKQYERLFIDPKTLKDKPFEQAGYNHLMRTVKETGINLQLNAIDEDINNLKKIAKDNGGYLMPDQLEQLDKLAKKEDELYKQNDELDNEYPEKLFDKISDAIQEILGQKMSWLDYVKGKTNLAFKHTLEGAWEMVSSPFMSDESNNMRELGIMGENIAENNIYHKTDKNKGLTTDTLVIKPELQTQIDAIVNDKSLDASQKEAKLYPLLRDNKDKFGRVPLKKSKLNVSPSSILYGVTDIGTTLLPFVALETVTGGGASAGIVRKFLSTFTAAATTGFHDTYAEALMEGKSQSEAYKYAMGITAINSFAMAGAGTPQAIRSMAGLKTSAGQIINKMTDAEIESALKNTPKAIKLFGKNIQPLLEGAANRVKATPKMLKEGLESGAKFEGAMTAANEVKHQIYNTPIDREENFKQSILGVINFGILGAGLGHIGYKSPTELQKSSFLETGKNPTEYIEQAKLMLKDGHLSQAEFDQVKNNIESSATAYKNLPMINSKGVELSEKEKGDYLYNEAVKNESLKKQLPPRQKEKAEHTALVADFKNDYILDPKTDKQLEARKVQLGKSLEPKKDAEGKVIEPNEKEVKEVKAELEAINDIINNKKSETVDSKGIEDNDNEQTINKSENQQLTKEKDTHQSEKIEGIDQATGIPEGDNVPPPTNPEIKTENGVLVEPPQKIPEPIPLKNEVKAEVPENTIQAESEGAVNSKVGEVEQPAKEGGQKPPVEPPVNETGIPKEEGIGITHVQTSELRKEKGFDAYEKEPKKFAEWDAEADKRIADNKMPELIKRMERGDEIDAVEQRMMGKYIATLNAEVSKNPTKENIANLKKAVELSDIVGGRQIGQSLVARKGTFLPDDSLGKYIIEETEAYGVKDLPQETITQLKDRFDKEQQLQSQIEEAYKKGREEALKENAKNEFSKIISSTKKVRKTKEEFVNERKDIIQQMRADLLKVAKGGSGTMATIPLAPQLIAIAPHVAKLVKSLAQEGFYKLEDVINRVHDELKDIVPVSKKDVRDLIAGEYNEKKSTRNEIAETIRNLQSESKLLNELERVRKDEPKTTESQIKKDIRIQELENKIKEIKKLKKIKGLEEPVKDISVEDEAKISARKKQILNQVAKLQEDIKNKKYEQVAEPPRKVKLDKETQKLQDRLIEMKRQDAVRRAKAEYEKTPKWRRRLNTFYQITGLRRLIQAAVDFSIPFRQASSISMNPFKYAKVENGKLKTNTALKAWGKMFSVAFSPKKYNRFQYQIENSEIGKTFMESEGVFSNPSEVRMDKREEEFTNNILGRLRQKIDAGDNKTLQKTADIVDKAWFSERAAAGFLNTVRVEEFAKQIKNLEKQGKTLQNSPNDYKEAAKWVMNITGRGNMLKVLEDSKAGKEIANQAYFGARLMAAKINMLNPVYYAKMPKEVRVQAFKDMAGAVTGMFLVGFAAQAAGASVSLNPDDPDFLQIRFGNKVYDISGGSAGYVRTFMRLVKAAVNYDDKGYRKFALGSVAKTLFVNKLAPNTSYIYHGITGKSAKYDENGKLKDFDPAEIFEFAPLYVDDAKKGLQEEGIGALFTVLAPSMFGIGYQNYPKR